MRVRLVADTARAQAAMASISAVHDIAMPTMTPRPKISITVPVAAIVTPDPRGVEEGAKHGDQPAAELVCISANNRLGRAPDEVLHCNCEHKICDGNP